jgi:16S rRNA (uracil1498-N3)-methyltransferase
MQQYFVKQITNNQAIITGSDVHHIKHVMRFKIGDHIRVCADQVCYLGTLSAIEQEVVSVSIIKPLDSTELNGQIDIAQALIKRDKFELVLQKASELGVHTILPIHTNRTIIKLKSNKLNTKVSRWNAITKEACEQSERAHLVTVHPPVDVDKIPFETYDQVLVLYARESLKHLRFTPAITTQKILIMIGPEGGFTEEEISQLSRLKNSEIVSLGPHILRSETAALAVLSMAQYVKLGDAL